MPVAFHKMHGLGNDFVLLDLRCQDFQLDADIVSHLADRHTGIGCDQLLVLCRSSTVKIYACGSSSAARARPWPVAPAPVPQSVSCAGPGWWKKLCA